MKRLAAACFKALLQEVSVMCQVWSLRKRPDISVKGVSAVDGIRLLHIAFPRSEGVLQRLEAISGGLS